MLAMITRGGGPRYAGLGTRGAMICWPGYEEGQDMLNGSYIRTYIHT